MEYSISVNGRAHRVTVISRKGVDLTLDVEGVKHQVTVTEMPALRAAQTGQPTTVKSTIHIEAAQAPQAKVGSITAPIPGVISDVRVSVGDVVSAGQVVAVLEAMKMENNITSVSGGIVKEISVTKGEQVKKGQVLVVVE